MRRIAFIIAIVGLGLLVALLLQEPIKVDSLNDLIIGQVIQIEGEVDSQRDFGSGKLLIINELHVFCECSKSYAGLNVSVTGIIERFPSDLRIKAFKVEILD